MWDFLLPQEVEIHSRSRLRVLQIRVIAKLGGVSVHLFQLIKLN